MVIEFYLEENPKGTAQQKGESVSNGRIHHFEKANVRKMRQIYKEKILHEMERDSIKAPLIEGPVFLSVDFYFSIKDKKKQNKWKDTKPDLDNSVKLLQDVLSDLGFFAKGDEQVACLVLHKFWSVRPRVKIEISPIVEDEDDDTV